MVAKYRGKRYEPQKGISLKVRLGNNYYYALVLLLLLESLLTAGSLKMGSFGDRGVLLELFRATNGPLWAKKQGWNTTASISTWFGVTVDKDGCVVKLELIDNDLQGGATVDCVMKLYMETIYLCKV